MGTIPSIGIIRWEERLLYNHAQCIHEFSGCPYGVPRNSPNSNKKDIVETVIGELLFHSDYVQGVTCERALSLFKKLNTEVDTYVVVLKKLRSFDLCVKYIACGTSFQMASRLMNCPRVESGISFYEGCTDFVDSSCARVVCVHSLQILSGVIAKTWCFSIALDASTHQGMSYLDTWVPFFWEGAIHNFHLMVISLFERHSGENVVHVLYYKMVDQTQSLKYAILEW